MKRNFVFFLSINFTLYFNLKISILFSSLLFLSFKPNTLLWLPQLTNLFHKLHFPWALRCWTFAKYMWVLHLIKQIVYMKKGTYGERAHMLCRLGFFVIGLVCVMRGGCGMLESTLGLQEALFFASWTWNWQLKFQPFIWKLMFLTIQNMFF